MFKKFEITPKIVLMLIMFSLGNLVLNLSNVVIPEWSGSLKTSPGYFNSIYTWMYSSMLFAGAIAVPIWNSITEKYGPKRVIFITAIVYGASQALIGTIGHYHIAIILSLRVVIGFVGGPVLFTTLRGLVSNSATEKNRTAILNFAAVLQGLTTAGIFLGMGYLSIVVNFKWIFVIQGLSMIVFAITFMAATKTPVLVKTDSSLFKQTKKDLSDFKGKGFYTLLMGYIPMSLFLSSATMKFRKTIIDDIGDTNWVAYLQIAISLLTIIITLLLIPIMKKTVGLKLSAAIFAVISVIMLAISIQSFNTNISRVLLFAFFQSFIVGSQSFYIAAATSKFKHKASTVMSVFQTVSYLGTAIGLIVLEYIQSSFHLGYELSYITIGGIMLTVIYLVVRKELKTARKKAVIRPQQTTY